MELERNSRKNPKRLGRGRILFDDALDDQLRFDSVVHSRVGTAHQWIAVINGQCPAYALCAAILCNFAATSSGIGIETGTPPCGTRQHTLVILPVATLRPSWENANKYVTLFVPTR